MGVEWCGEPGGSPGSQEEGGDADCSQDRNSLARIPVAKRHGETWFPPRTQAEGERCSQTECGGGVLVRADGQGEGGLASPPRGVRDGVNQMRRLVPAT